MSCLEVLRPGPLCLVQDLGRPGRAGEGITLSGALDRTSLVQGNRLLGNTIGAPGLEMLFGGLAVAGLKALQGLEWEVVEPLFDEMMTCVSIMSDEKNPELDRPLVMGLDEGDDVEELSTYLELRQKVFEIHTSFFSRGK